jgi:hypothetical protein
MPAPSQDDGSDRSPAMTMSLERWIALRQTALLSPATTPWFRRAKLLRDFTPQKHSTVRILAKIELRISFLWSVAAHELRAPRMSQDGPRLRSKGEDA